MATATITGHHIPQLNGNPPRLVTVAGLRLTPLCVPRGSMEGDEGVRRATVIPSAPFKMDSSAPSLAAPRGFLPA